MKHENLLDFTFHTVLDLDGMFDSDEKERSSVLFILGLCSQWLCILKNVRC